MDFKTLMASALGAGVTLIVTLIVQEYWDESAAGAEALTTAQIRDVCTTVVDERLKTDDGLTHDQAISSLNGSVVELATKMDSATTEMRELRRAVLTLAGQ